MSMNRSRRWVAALTATLLLTGVAGAIKSGNSWYHPDKGGTLAGNSWYHANGD